MYKAADLNAFTDVQETDALWSIQLMAAGTKQREATLRCGASAALWYAPLLLRRG